MSATPRHFYDDGRSYTLYAFGDDPLWSLYEEFGDESALVGIIARRGAQYSVECFWKPESALRDVDATTLEEATTALLLVSAGEDPRAH
ncbi:hypothetical protein [Leifsonia sp. AG29]|uniref:hypothetical protein n=1 Tax=Leifsonia sp. AG29 TaxID=2598860 RepID=UPI00131AF77A|nr:hypothetical protein [Leifsonia sp. AG29]